MNKTIKLLLSAVALAILAFIAYGLETDCPDTAIYYYCGGE